MSIFAKEINSFIHEKINNCSIGGNHSLVCLL